MTLPTLSAERVAPLQIEQPTRELIRNLLKLPRKLLFAIHPDLAARILGGWSLLVLAK